MTKGNNYPFGMGIRGEWKFVQPQIGGIHYYQYNGKELNEDFYPMIQDEIRVVRNYLKKK